MTGGIKCDCAAMHMAMRASRSDATSVTTWLIRRPAVGKHLYSNLGYVVAGAMAERVTARSWESLMQERLFAPLGISSADFGAPGVPG